MATQTNKFNRDLVDNEDIRQLRVEAASYGDEEMVRDCDAALEEGDSDAAERCIDAIEEAWNRAQ